MERQIIIEFYPWETRVGIVEDGRLVEVFWENPEARVGKIYKGIVKDIVPGLSCAFIDVGLERNAFLFVNDAVRGGTGLRIQDILKSGQEVMVQVKKEAVADKGARVTRDLSIPGRYLVLFPCQDGVCVSRKITDSQRRSELKHLIEEAKPPGIGIIVRTTAGKASKHEILADLEGLMGTWGTIAKNYQQAKAPGEIYHDVELSVRALREYLDDNTRAVVINEPGEKNRIEELLRQKAAGYSVLVRHEPGDLFLRYGLEKELKRALQRRVRLKHGGYLVIDETEAMTVIDVNSGKFIGQSEFEDTVLKTNLDAALEIPRQLRLRRIGGIVLVDFIDMRSKEHQDQVINRLREELNKDKAHTRVLGLTRLGLLEMTRQKSRYGLSEILTDECCMCQGKGRLLNRAAIVNEIRRKLFNLDYIEAGIITCQVSPELIGRLKEDENSLRFIESKLGKQIRLEEVKSFTPAEYNIVHG